MNIKIEGMIRLVYSLLMGVLLLCACQKDDYYIDGGKANPYYDGDILQYIESKPMDFDTVAQVIKLAGMEAFFRNEEFTFFAPRDLDIKNMIGNMNIPGSANYLLFMGGKDTIQALTDVDSTIWRRYLMRHIFKGKNLLADYPQIDFEVRSIFPGQNFYNYDETTVLNIGVVYNDAGGIKYNGYRQLAISYIPDVSRPNDDWLTRRVASSDIQPKNGVIHALAAQGDFGFSRTDVTLEIFLSKP
ncbi:MAG TPA: hypothetical protein VN040_17415 [Pseudosphingobacterium sp.]|nr:hypothetical protein [Pseudosphingobacterium sp.]